MKLKSIVQVCDEKSNPKPCIFYITSSVTSIIHKNGCQICKEKVSDAVGGYKVWYIMIESFRGPPMEHNLLLLITLLGYPYFLISVDRPGLGILGVIPTTPFLRDSLPLQKVLSRSLPHYRVLCKVKLSLSFESCSFSTLLVISPKEMHFYVCHWDPVMAKVAPVLSSPSEDRTFWH